MREIRPSGSEGGARFNLLSLPLSVFSPLAFIGAHLTPPGRSVTGSSPKIFWRSYSQPLGSRPHLIRFQPPPPRPHGAGPGSTRLHESVTPVMPPAPRRTPPGSSPVGENGSQDPRSRPASRCADPSPGARNPLPNNLPHHTSATQDPASQATTPTQESRSHWSFSAGRFLQKALGVPPYLSNPPPYNASHEHSKNEHRQTKPAWKFSSHSSAPP
jgi:hypothetical protein